MAHPWTQALSIRWRPLLRFYEQRIAILREFEDQGVLKAFSVSQDRIAGRLLDPGHELVVDREGLDLRIVAEDSDFQSLWSFVETATRRLEPVKPRLTRVDLQHIVALDAPFVGAVAAAQATLFALPAISEMICDDFSVLLDIHRSSNLRGRIEFGIIQADEALERLSRSVGRMAQRDRRAQTQIEPVWAHAEFPAVALFVDSAWFPELGEDETIDAMLESCENVKHEASEIVEALYSKILLGLDEGGMLKA